MHKCLLSKLNSSSALVYLEDVVSNIIDLNGRGSISFVYFRA